MKRIPKLFTLSPECVAHLAQIADAAGLSRSRMVEHLVMQTSPIVITGNADSQSGPSVSKARRRRLKR